MAGGRTALIDPPSPSPGLVPMHLGARGRRRRRERRSRSHLGQGGRPCDPLLPGGGRDCHCSTDEEGGRDSRCGMGEERGMVYRICMSTGDLLSYCSCRVRACTTACQTNYMAATTPPTNLGPPPPPGLLWRLQVLQAPREQPVCVGACLHRYVQGRRGAGAGGKVQGEGGGRGRGRGGGGRGRRTRGRSLTSCSLL